MNKKIPLLNVRVNFRKEKDEWILMTPSGKMLAVNDTAIILLKHCDGHATIDDIINMIAKLFNKADLPKKTIIDFFSVMKKAKCIEIIDETFVAPTAFLLGPAGLVDMSTVDERVFLKGMSADPPCQS